VATTAADFEDVQDYETMKDLMREMARRFQVDLHAYVLLPAQFHVLATPETEEGLPLFMQSVGRSYVRYFNNRHGRSGTLWEGRYRSTVLEASAYLLPCMVVLETQPVAEGLVGRPQDYLWSSYAHNAGVQQDSLVRSHAQYWAGQYPFAREAAYQRTVEQGCRQPWRKRCGCGQRGGPWDRRILWRNCGADPAAPDPAASGAAGAAAG
jgi:putative transposase